MARVRHTEERQESREVRASSGGGRRKLGRLEWRGRTSFGQTWKAQTAIGNVGVAG